MIVIFITFMDDRGRTAKSCLTRDYNLLAFDQKIVDERLCRVKGWIARLVS